MNTKIDTKLLMKLKKASMLSIVKCKEALLEADGDFDKAVELLRKQGKKFASKRLGRDTQEGAVIALTNPEHTCGVILALNCETDFVAQNEALIQLGKAMAKAALAAKAPDLEAMLALPADSGESFKQELDLLIGTFGENMSVSQYAFLQGPVVASYVHTGNKLGAIVALQGKNLGEEIKQAAKYMAIQVTVLAPLAIQEADLDPVVLAKEKEIIEAQMADQLAKAPSQEIADRMLQGKLSKFMQENILLEQPYALDDSQKVKQYLASVASAPQVVSFKRAQAGA